VFCGGDNTYSGAGACRCCCRRCCCWGQVLGVLEKASSSFSGGSGHSDEQLRALLGQFLFKGREAAARRVGCLSGGEKARLALARLLLSPANLLVKRRAANHFHGTVLSLEAARRAPLLHDLAGIGRCSGYMQGPRTLPP